MLEHRENDEFPNIVSLHRDRVSSNSEGVNKVRIAKFERLNPPRLEKENRPVSAAALADKLDNITRRLGLGGGKDHCSRGSNVHHDHRKPTGEKQKEHGLEEDTVQPGKNSKRCEKN